MTLEFGSRRSRRTEARLLKRDGVLLACAGVALGAAVAWASTSGSPMGHVVFKVNALRAI
jgi:hypothetical protein